MWIGNLTITGKALLAPMAGITDVVFRRICRRFGAAVVYSEFLSTDGLIYNTLNQEHKLAMADDEHPVAFQLFGARTQTFGQAARMLASYQPDLIDLNFGCPVKKVVGKNGGAAILKDLDLLESIVRETVDSVPLPVTVKMRAGWDRHNLVYHEAAARAINAGARAITLHARTRADGAWGAEYGSAADWSYIADLRRTVTTVPLIGNGDITSPETAAAMLAQTGCDAVMVGRAALGRPWIFAEINHFLELGERLPPPALADRLCVAWEHLRQKVETSPDTPAVAVRGMRKQLAEYLRGLPYTHELKAHLMRVETVGQIRMLLSEYLDAQRDLSEAPGDDWLSDFMPLERDWMSHAPTAVAC
ncbi:MAG: tRNA dihydrouridine synthase DusB [candidate division Zixibacteria bacterium]|nr:tRNA dihydrouridine synthase DusB [candidate division Zixibacteria bacterium]